MTLCRNVKKDLIKGIDAIAGGENDERFWATCEQERVNLYVDIYMEDGQPGQPPLRPPQLYLRLSNF